MLYPDVTDEDFYEFINDKYNKYKIPKTKQTLKQICFPKKYEFQIPQKFVAEFINPKTPYTGLLIYHKIGAGKTCAAVKICENFKNKKKIIIVVPAALKNNFRAELRSLCAGENYLKNEERKLLTKYHPSDSEYKAIIAKSNNRIDKYYSIKSYNKFIEQLKDKTLKLDNTLVVIDEIHNLISETGTYYETLYGAFKKAPDTTRLIIMTATPIFDKPIEIALTMNLLIKKPKMPIGKKFYEEFIEEKVSLRGITTYETKNMDVFKEYIKGYVSYFAGAPEVAFPRSEIHIVKCEMSDYQLKLYQKVFKKESKNNKPLDPDTTISNSFFIGTRLISNFVFPNGKLNIDGFNSLGKKDLDTEHLKKYSPKFLKVLRRIKRCNGTVFVYSNFKQFGGLAIFAEMLNYHKFKNYEENGPGKKRYAIWSGDTDDLIKDEIKNVFNNKKNEFGSELKIILGSPSASTGVSFFRVQEVHLLESYWNMSKILQIIGRALRFCSHKDVELERQLVKVYIYLSVHPKLDISIDQHILNIAIQKQKINIGFERALKEAAIDCELFSNANNQGTDDKIVCEI